MNKWVTMLVAMSLSLSALGDNRVTLGAPKTAEGQPAMYFGVNSCGSCSPMDIYFVLTMITPQQT